MNGSVKHQAKPKCQASSGTAHADGAASVRTSCTGSRRPHGAARAADLAAWPTLTLPLPLRPGPNAGRLARKEELRVGDPKFSMCRRVCSRSAIVASPGTCQERLRRSSDRLRRLLTEPGRESRSLHLSGACRGTAQPTRVQRVSRYAASADALRRWRMSTRSVTFPSPNRPSGPSGARSLNGDSYSRATSSTPRSARLSMRIRDPSGPERVPNSVDLCFEGARDHPPSLSVK